VLNYAHCLAFAEAASVTVMLSVLMCGVIADLEVIALFSITLGCRVSAVLGINGL
jgi:hypothetical protein